MINFVHSAEFIIVAVMDVAMRTASPQSAWYRNQGFLWRTSFPVKFHHGWKSRGSIDHLNDTKKSCGSGMHLFLFWNQSVCDIYQSHISRWIIEVVKTAFHSSDKELSEKVTAHELKALASAWAYNHQISVEDVLFAAFWRSSGVFQKKYLMDLTPIARSMAPSGPVVAVQHVCGHYSFSTHLHSYTIVHTLIHSTYEGLPGLQQVSFS